MRDQSNSGRGSLAPYNPEINHGFRSDQPGNSVTAKPNVSPFTSVRGKQAPPASAPGKSLELVRNDENVPPPGGKYLNLNALGATSASSTPSVAKAGKPPTSHFYLHPQGTNSQKTQQQSTSVRSDSQARNEALKERTT
jgi:hypothetical protein